MSRTRKPCRPRLHKRRRTAVSPSFLRLLHILPTETKAYRMILGRECEAEGPRRGMSRFQRVPILLEAYLREMQRIADGYEGEYPSRATPLGTPNTFRCRGHVRHRLHLLDCSIAWNAGSCFNQCLDIGFPETIFHLPFLETHIHNVSR